LESCQKVTFFYLRAFFPSRKPCQLDMSSRYLQLNYLLIDWQVSRMELHDIPDSSQYRFHDGCEFCGSSAFWENTFLSVPGSLGYLHDFVVYNWRNLWAQKVQSLLNRVRTKKALKVMLSIKKMPIWIWYVCLIWWSVTLFWNNMATYKITFKLKDTWK